MAYLKEHLLPTLIGAALAGLGTAVVSIYADLLPLLMPALAAIPPARLLKIIALLAVSLFLAVLVAIKFAVSSKPLRPLAKSGKAYGLKWIAQFDYSRKRSEEVEVELRWFCPQHRVPLGIKDAEVENCAYHTLYCAKCDRLYPLEDGGAQVHLEEAESVVRLNLLSRLRLPHAIGG